MYIKIIILVLLSLALPDSKKIDLNSASYDELKTLPISEEKIISISKFLEFELVETIYDLLYVPGINIQDIHDIRSFVKIQQNYLTQMNFKENNIFTDETYYTSIPKRRINHFYKAYNVNNITFDQLMKIQNFSPIDAVAVLKQQQKININGTFQLKNSPGISHFGYKNLLSRISFKEDEDKLVGNFEAIVRSNSELITDDEEQEIYYSGKSNPGMFSRLYFHTKNSSFGLLRYNNSGDPSGIQTNKIYVDFDNIVVSKTNDIRIDHFIVGNFKAAYGEGLVFASGDESRRRFTGYKWNKRHSGVTPDIGTSEQLTLNGVAFQTSWRPDNGIFSEYRLSYFISNDKRDAIINDDMSFTSLIFMRPRLGWGSTNENQDRINENMVDALIEKTEGANIRFTINNHTRLGFTWYKSLYNRELDPQIIRTVVGGGEDVNPDYDDGTVTTDPFTECDDENPIFDTNNDGCICCDGDYYAADEDEYSGDAWYLNYPHSNPADNEINAMYSDSTVSGKSDYWKSQRIVSGINFNTVINNLSLHSEYASMSTPTGIQKAVLIKGYWKLADNLDVLILHRNYDLGFDNPYQKSFSEYQRYKSSIFEDEWWLEDPIYTYLYQLNPQPQAEKGTYLESRYQFHEKFVLNLQWDSWLRKADAARYFRMVTKLEWRPLFNYRVYFRYKLQARGNFSIQHPSPYYLKEARIRFKLRLSNYDNLEILYSWNESTFSPRPRLVDSANPFVISMNVGDTGSPDESIGFSLEHNFNDDFVISGGSVYAHGFLWYFDTSDFSLFSNDFGLINTWFRMGLNPTNETAISFKVSHSWVTPNSRVVGGMTSNGNYVGDTYILEEQLNYRFQIDYAFK